jgi:hypothetical protein
MRDSRGTPGSHEGISLIWPVDRSITARIFLSKKQNAAMSPSRCSKLAFCVLAQIPRHAKPALLVLPERLLSIGSHPQVFHITSPIDGT